MKIETFWIAVLLAAFFAGPLRADSSRESAQAAWKDRAQPEQIERSIHLWEKALQENPGQTDILIWLTRASSSATRQAEASDQKRRWADAARRWGAEAISKNPQSSEAYARDAEALAEWAQAHKGIHSLKAVRQAVERLQKAVALDPRNAFAHMLLSQLYRQSPRGISVGNKEKALEEGRLAAQAGPAYAINHLAYAQALLDMGHSEEGRQELRAAIALPAPAEAVPETASDQKTARELLKKLGEDPPSPSPEKAGEAPAFSSSQTSCSKESKFCHE